MFALIALALAPSAAVSAIAAPPSACPIDRAGVSPHIIVQGGTPAAPSPHIIVQGGAPANGTSPATSAPQAEACAATNRP